MLFTSDYSIKMPIIEAILTSFIGLFTVIIILAVIAGLIILVSKVIRGLESKISKNETPSAVTAENTPAAIPAPSSVELVGVDEETAAVIMAIVSDKSGIPLNRLAFKSIKLMEDK